MTASDLAGLLNGKRISKGKWIAKCPHHHDKRPSLAVTEGKRGVLIKCMSAGCETRDVLTALGLTFDDLFYDKATPAVRARTSLQQLKEDLTVQWQSARMLGSLEPKRRNYWKAVERNTYRDLQLVRCRLEPLEVYRELRNERWQRMNASRRERYLEGVYGEYCAREGATGR